MQSQTKLPKNFRLELTTTVLSPSGEKIRVYADYQWTSQQRTVASEILGDRYRATIKINEDSPELGFVLFDFQTREDRESQYSHHHPPPRIFIVNMENNSDYAHVGNALHEATFKASLRLGAKGRVLLDAVRDTHYFHYKNGFRSEEISVYSEVDYYLRLAKALKEAKGNRIQANLNSKYLYLPSQYRQANLKKFGLPEDSCDLQPESKGTAARIRRCEMLIEETLRGSLSSKLLFALDEGFGSRDDMPAKFKMPAGILKRINPLYETWKSKNPSLFDSTTNDILKEASRLLLNKLPIDSTEKEKALVTVMTGMMVLAMVLQDEQYGKQFRYGNQLLYPHKTSKELLGAESKNSIDESIMLIGEMIITQAIPFETIHPQFFPQLNAIPELHALINKFLPSTCPKPEAEPNPPVPE